jgi:outer membrane protein assembly factor BamB
MLRGLPAIAAALLAVLRSGPALHAEGSCMYPAPVGCKVYAIEVKTGKGRPIFSWGSGPLGAPAVSQGMLYVGTNDNLFALDAATGKHLWINRYVLSEQVVPTADAVYLGNPPRALDPRTGKERWKVENLRGSGNLVVTEDLVIAGVREKSQIGGVRAFARQDGTERWQTTLKGGDDPTFLLTQAAADLLFVGRTDEAHLLDLRTGKQLWDHRAEWPARPQEPQSQPTHVVCAGAAVYRFKPPAGDQERGGLEAIDVRTRQPRWLTRLPFRIDWNASLTAAGDLVFLSRDEEVHVFDAGTGELLWQVPGVALPVQIEVSRDANLVLLLDGRDRIRALDRKTGKLQWLFDELPREPGKKYLGKSMTLDGATLYLSTSAYYDPRWLRPDRVAPGLPSP